MKRRDFVKLGMHSVTLLSTWSASTAMANASSSQQTLSQIFTTFIDTLIPEDSTASASQLGLDNVLLEHAATIENYPELIELGCTWLNEQSFNSYQKSFLGLSEPQRTRIVVLSEQATALSIEKQFFERVKADLFRLYYSNPATWSGIAFDNPPQPKGYPDYAEKPLKWHDPK